MQGTASSVLSRRSGHLLLRAVGFVALLSALWAALHRLLASDRGIDLTDEGLYLLAADPPSIDAAWGTPFGWHTAPVFRAVGYDVAAFRTLGAWLLVLASAALGWWAVRLGERLRAAGVAGRSTSVAASLRAVAGGVGGFLYYGGLLRTRSYNWVTVVGATIAAVGIVMLVEHMLRSGCDRPGEGKLGELWQRTAVQRLGLHVGHLIAGLGAFLSIPAKPTTPILFALAFMHVDGATAVEALAFAGERLAIEALPKAHLGVRVLTGQLRVPYDHSVLTV